MARCVMVCASAELALPAYPGAVDVPLYVATIEWVPTPRPAPEHVAALPLSDTALHKVLAPSVNVTVPTPEGFPAPDVTVAV
jgi:hypothetical protein